LSPDDKKNNLEYNKNKFTRINVDKYKNK